MTWMDNLEILYILRSSRDHNGRRVLLRYNKCENFLYPGEAISEFDVGIWNLTEDQQEDIESFLRDGDDDSP